MKRKRLLSLILCTFILAGAGMTSVHASEGQGDTTIGYEADSSSIKITVEGKSEVIKGTSGHSYKAFADGNTTAVVWSIKGATSKNTRIDEGGFLIVGVDETSDEIEIIANSTQDPSKYASMKVKLIEKTYTVVSVERKEDITMAYGTTADQLKKRLQEYDTFQVTIRTNDGKTYVIDVDRAKYGSSENVVGSDGIVKEGSFTVNYELILPYLMIDYDGTITKDRKKDTNITGEAKTSIMVTIEKKNTDTGQKPEEKPSEKPGETPGETENKKPIEGTTGPNTGDRTKKAAYIAGMTLLPMSLLFVYYKRRKDRKEAN